MVENGIALGCHGQASVGHMAMAEKKTQSRNNSDQPHDNPWLEGIAVGIVEDEPSFEGRRTVVQPDSSGGSAPEIEAGGHCHGAEMARAG